MTANHLYLNGKWEREYYQRSLALCWWMLHGIQSWGKVDSCEPGLPTPTPHLKTFRGFFFFEIHTTPVQSLQGSARSSPSLPFPPPLILSPLLMKLQQNSFQQVLGHTKLLPISGPLNLLGPLSIKFLVCLTPTYPPGLIFNIISLNRFSLTTLSQGASSTPTHQHPIIF